MRHLQTFEAVSEIDGRSVTMHVYQDAIDIGTRAEPGKTAGGEAANYVGPRVYEVGGGRFRSDDPAAP